MPSRVTGVERAIKALNRKISKVEEITTSTLVRVGLLIQRDAMINTPVDTGALRLSCFTVWKGGKSGTGVLTSAHGRTPSEQKKIAEESEKSMMFMANTERDATIIEHPVVFVGFGASYAIFVHEREDAEHAVGGPYFLVDAVAKHIKSIENLIVEEAAGRL